MKGWKGSQVEDTFQIVVTAIADGSLTPDEIKVLAAKLAKDWLPAKAASKVNQYINAGTDTTAPEYAAVKAVTDFINGNAANTAVFTEIRNLFKLKK
jgi:hypothetical protein